MTEPLLPCPFCGAGNPRLLPQAEGWRVIDCVSCGASVREITRYDEQVRAKWNMRKPYEALEQRLREATNLDTRDAELVTLRRELTHLKQLGRKLRRGCDCEYDHRCSNCQAILDVLKESA